jgi:hypothetical protein
VNSGRGEGLKGGREREREKESKKKDKHLVCNSAKRRTLTGSIFQIGTHKCQRTKYLPSRAKCHIRQIALLGGRSSSPHLLWKGRVRARARARARLRDWIRRVRIRVRVRVKVRVTVTVG